MTKTDEKFLEAGVVYQSVDPKTQMSAPYKRIFIMHFTIILSGFLFLALNEPRFSVVLLVVFKILADYVAHRKEHRVAV